MQIVRTSFKKMLRRSSVSLKTRLKGRCSRSGKVKSASMNKSCKRHMRVRAQLFSRLRSLKSKCRSSRARLRSSSGRNVW